MKIVVTGSIGVGKSTFFRAIPENPSIIKIPEVARRVLNAAPDLRLNPYFQRVLLLEQYFLEKEAEKLNKQIILCDRGYFDVIAYAKYFGVDVDHELLNSFTPYDMILYCDPEGTPPAPEEIPGVKPNPEEKNRVDQSILATLHELSIPWFTLKGPTEKRLERFYQILSESREGRIRQENQFDRSYRKEQF